MTTETTLATPGFNELGLAEPILRAIADAGYTTPAPIQAQAIPQALAGGDLLAAAQTGTGNTDLFALEQSTAQALASSCAVKLGAYPRDVLQKNAIGHAPFPNMEIQPNTTALKRECQRNGIAEAEFIEKIEVQRQKQIKAMAELREKW